MRKINVTTKMQYAELTALRSLEGRLDDRLVAVYRECEDATLRRLDLAMQAFVRRAKRGEKAGYPRFRPRSRWQTLQFPHGNRALRLNELQTKVTVPGVGAVRLRKGRSIPPFGQAMISLRAGRWYAGFECERDATALDKTGRNVGIDRGIVAIVATSDDELIALPKTFSRHRARIHTAQKRVSRRTRGGRRRGKARLLLARAHEAAASARRDFLHKVSRSIVDRYEMIAIEKLDVRGMTQSSADTPAQPGKNVRAKSGLNREILNAGWSTLRQFLVEKAECAGRTIVEVDPKNTSRECSFCRLIDAGSRRSQSEFVCVACGYAANADINAACVILKRAELRPAGSLGALTPGVDLRSALASGRTRFSSHDAA
jgi:putative transposase